MNDVIVYEESDVTVGQIQPMLYLTNSVWPGDKTVEQLVEVWATERGADHANGDTLHRRFAIWQDNQVIAHARTFLRTVHATNRSLPVLALAAVCTDPVHRGRGLGAAVVCKAFEQVDDGTAPVSLFQTGVPRFYEKLGCRIVNNDFVNKLDKTSATKNPWWDHEVMIYPASFEWPTGTINLNGPGY